MTKEGQATIDMPVQETRTECAYYAWWDGDDCRLYKMKIINPDRCRTCADYKKEI